MIFVSRACSAISPVSNYTVHARGRPDHFNANNSTNNQRAGLIGNVILQENREIVSEKKCNCTLSYETYSNANRFPRIFCRTCCRCNIYISRLCYDVSVRLSVRLSVTFVHCGHSVQWISDIFACLDRWMSLLLTDNASPGSTDGMMPGFLVEEGRGMEKLVIVAISLNLLTESLDQKQLTVPFCLHMNDVDIYVIL